MKRGILPATAFLVILAVAAQATIIRVPEDYTLIQMAIDAATEGDTVELADGLYMGVGNRDLDFMGKNLTLMSGSGDPEACVIDAEGSEENPHRVIDFHSGESHLSRVEGLGITGGWMVSDYYSGGGGIHCGDGSSPTISNCLFAGNSGSALYCRNESNVHVSDCRFIDNMGEYNGAGVNCLMGYHTFYRCEFSNNSAKNYGGGVHGHAADFDFQDCVFLGNDTSCGPAVDMIYGCNAVFQNCLFDNHTFSQSYWTTVINLHGMVTGTFEDCTFSNNSTPSGGSVIVTSKMSHGILRGCTIWGNSMPNGTLISFGELDGIVENTIIAGNPAGRPLAASIILELSCTNIYGNTDGDWVDGLEVYLGVDGNISEDPLFCDPMNGNFYLRDSSPCAPFSPPNFECDLIGAWPVACTTATNNSTWSSLKILY